MQFQEDFDDTEVELVAGSEPYISSAAAEFDIDDEAGFDDLGEVGTSVANAAVGSDDDLPPGLPNARNQRQTTTPAPGLSKPAEPVSYTVPDVIKNFLLYFQRNVKENNLHEIHSIYESSWSKLTDRYFKNTPWPNPAAVAQFINKDDIFLVLYKELYFRHLYTKLNPTLEQRFESWQNYCDLFNALIDASPFLSLELPNQWLWDIIDEFIYQFQSFCQFRARPENKADDLAQLKANPQIWNALTVLNYLQSLISKSNVVAILEKERSGHHVDRDHSVPALYRMLGTFSIIGLVRLHVLMGDYYLALKTLDPIDLTNKGLYTRVSACHVNLHYYLAFAYVMTRRYLDAIRTLSNILTFISRTKQYHSRTHHDQISKKNEQMYALLSITVSLCPQRIDENIHNTLREKYGDKMIRMQRGEEAVFKEVFVFACPKFVTCSPPNYDELTPGSAQEASRVQLKLFLNEVKQQTQIPTIRSFLKLYTTIGTQKLADYLETNQEEFVMQLLCMKHKTRGATWNGGSLLNTKFAPSSDVDFYVDQNMVHIANTKISRRFGEYFIRHTLKFDNLLHNLQNLDAAKADR